MNLEYVSIGRNPPAEVNAIIEVPIGGKPIKYEWDARPRPLSLYAHALSGVLLSSAVRPVCRRGLFP
jgi:hypothetical protein